MTTEPPVEELIEALGAYRTRAQARRQLEEIGLRAAPRLLALLEEHEAGPNEKWAAISLLGKCAYEPAVQPIIDAVREEPSLRAEARRALRRITGTDPGANPAQWQPPAAEAPAAAPDATSEGATTEEDQRAQRPELELVRKAVGDLAESVRWMPPDTVELVIASGHVSGQRLLVTFGGTNRKLEPVVCVHTDCGAATPALEAIMYRHNVTLRHGVYGVETNDAGERRAVLRCDALADTLTPLQLREIVVAMVGDLAQLHTELDKGEQVYAWRQSPKPTGLP